MIQLLLSCAVAQSEVSFFDAPNSTRVQLEYRSAATRQADEMTSARNEFREPHTIDSATLYVTVGAPTIGAVDLTWWSLVVADASGCILARSAPAQSTPMLPSHVGMFGSYWHNLWVVELPSARLLSLYVVSRLNDKRYVVTLRGGILTKVRGDGPPAQECNSLKEE